MVTYNFERETMFKLSMKIVINIVLLKYSKRVLRNINANVSY